MGRQGTLSTSPDENVDSFHTNDFELARDLQAAMNNPENHITFCYCSIFDECWVADSRRNLQEPEPVDVCRIQNLALRY